MDKKSVYDESSIQVLEGLKGVRKRPSMYIGSTDSKGLHHLVWEILDNSIDEAIAGYCDLIKIKINKDDSITISDNGRGIPTGKHKSGIDTPELIFSKLHSGGKFSSSVYKVSGGLHGVGSSVVNALSDIFIADIFRDGFHWNIKFEKGKLKDNLKAVKSSKLTGTTITFKPDASIFTSTSFSNKVISQRLKECAYLNSNIKIIFIDKKNISHTYHFEKGIETFIEDINKNNDSEHKAVNYSGEHNEIKITVAFQYVNDFSELIYSFANNIKTTEGGSHIIGFKIALMRAINNYAKQEKLIKEGIKLENNDIKEGLRAIISVLVPEKAVAYEGQTKTKLSSLRVRKAVEIVSYEKIFFWLQANKKISKVIIDKILITKKARLEAKKAKEMVQLGKTNKYKKIKMLSGKLTPAYSKNKAKRELFLVEGDSAGGSAKLGRNKQYQAILPLKGKIINAIKTNEMDILSNNEVQIIINSIGAGVGLDFNAKASNYGKIIIMTDADTDGAHIQILLLAFFYRYMRDLFSNNMIYIATPPLYCLKYSGKKEYFWDQNILKNRIATLNQKYFIQRYKGLGEMNYQQLWETTMDPENRKLIKINVEEEFEAKNSINILMGKESEKRKKWIEDNIDFINENIDLNNINNK